MKGLCKFCNNSVKLSGGYACLGGSKEKINEFEQQAKELKKYNYIHLSWRKWNKMNEYWKLSNEFKYRCRRLLEIKRWNSINLGIEMGIFYFTVYFLLWSIRIGDERWNMDKQEIITQQCECCGHWTNQEDLVWDLGENQLVCKLCYLAKEVLS